MLKNDALIKALARTEPVFWRNPHWAPFAEAAADVGLNADDVNDAAARLQRFAPYLAEVFPETANAGGLIESPLYAVPQLQAALKTNGSLYVKADNELPVSGSVKARGGIYEVLCHAEDVARQHGLLDGGYAALASPAAREVFGQYRISVGSTGNLGLSIGIMAAKLGFQAAVHMSADAQAWKKQRLRAFGVEVIEYASDYGAAVAAGRKLAESRPRDYFVDDEQSRRLFLGYAVAGARVQAQLEAAGIRIGAQRPLYVYLPCGVGGGPGGIAFGLKLAYGDHVHCIFVEPVYAPCMLLGVYSGLHENISVRDIGLTQTTAADGLAVARPSGFVGRALQRSLSAFATVSDAELFRLLQLAHRLENLKLEPSACAGFAALPHSHAPDNAVHMVWATGGSMVPDDVFAHYLAQAA